jgi:hypothetical protein
VISEATLADLRSLRTASGDGMAIALLVGVASLQMDDEVFAERELNQFT